MDRNLIRQQIIGHPTFKKLTTKEAQNRVKPTGAVYYKNDPTDIYVLFKYLGKDSQPGARYAILNFSKNTYENMPSKIFTDFYLKETQSYKEMRLTF